MENSFFPISLLYIEALRHRNPLGVPGEKILFFSMIKPHVRA